MLVAAPVLELPAKPFEPPGTGVSLEFWVLGSGLTLVSSDGAIGGWFAVSMATSGPLPLEQEPRPSEIARQEVSRKWRITFGLMSFQEACSNPCAMTMHVCA